MGAGNRRSEGRPLAHTSTRVYFTGALYELSFTVHLPLLGNNDEYRIRSTQQSLRTRVVSNTTTPPISHAASSDHVKPKRSQRRSAHHPLVFFNLPFLG
ncbi:hypothetical protein SK128_013037 [Halocaridina rubra]|uniref:Uncharacterized protein n=1 Tax=Halocaridina rubra TaxID=373956 RepID=A0AAN8WTP7_HALRR